MCRGKTGRILNYFKKSPKKGVDNYKFVRYNGGSLSKSAFPTSTNSDESEE